MVRTRAEKNELVAHLKDAFSGVENMFLVSLVGVSSNDVNALRASLRKQGARMMVVKNRLAKRAAPGSAAEKIEALFRGPTAVVSHDSEPVAIAKALMDFRKDHPAFEIRGGVVGGRDTVDGDGVKAVAEMPSLDEARSMLLALIQGPATKLVRLINTPASQLATVVKKRSEQES